MEYLPYVYSASATVALVLAIILWAAAIYRKSRLIGYMAVIITVMAADKFTSLWSLYTVMSDGIIYRQSIILRLIVKEVLYSLALGSFIGYLLSDYAELLVRRITGKAKT